MLALIEVPLRIESNLSMLLMAPVLYGIYIVLNRRNADTRAATVSDRLGGALSGPPLVLSLVMALALGTGAVLAIHYVGLTVPSWEFLATKFTQRGIIRRSPGAVLLGTPAARQQGLGGVPGTAPVVGFPR